MSKFLIVILCSFSLLSGVPAADDQAKLFSYDTTIGLSGAPDEVTGPSPAEPSGEDLIMLISDSGRNISEMNMTLYSAVGDFGEAGLKIGEVVHFAAPSSDWMLKSIMIVGWSGFNSTTGHFPPDKNFLIEVRGEYGGLLYKFADTQNFYFGSTEGPAIYKMDVPPLQVPRDFYVVFYDRGSMYLGAETGNGTGNSYLIINGRLEPAETLVSETNDTVAINWLIRAIGE